MKIAGKLGLDEESREFVYKLNNIIRYNTLARQKDETVAAHSYYVSLFSMLVADALDVPSDIKYMAIQFALIHDIPEVVINDITHDAKDNMPEVVDVLDKYERELQMQLFGDLGERYTKPTLRDDKSAKCISVIADILSVLQYTENELAMGNSHVARWDEQCYVRLKKEMVYLHDVLGYNELRIQKLWEHITSAQWVD